MSHNERLLEVDGAQLCVETFGDPTRPAILLVAGGATSMDAWEPEFCARLADPGHFVVRYDHRDTGRSSSAPAGHPDYSAADLATDPLRILDRLGVARAHLVGMSMGGGIVQWLAAHHPSRVLTLTLIAASPAGTRSDSTPLPSMHPRLAATFDNPSLEPDWADPDEIVSYLVDGERPYAGALGFDEDRVRGWVRSMVSRTGNVESASKNHWLLDDSTVAEFGMSAVAAPTLVLHGTDDPAFRFPHGLALAREIPRAHLVPLPGMGHEIPPPPLWDVAVDAILAHIGARARDDPHP
jgi:pimeloyl-ACP methyl ester carboxylesterase